MAWMSFSRLAGRGLKMNGNNLKIQGQFKFDLYTPQGELIKSSEYTDNFITNTGVTYPWNFAFADCFRFLTIGTGTGLNYTTYPVTTGLQYALPQYSYIGSRSAWNSGLNATYYGQPNNIGAGCGYVNNPSGVSLIRQWNLPDNTGGVFATDQTFNEFMVSPGRPYITGIGGVNLCSCNDTDGTNHGLDCSSTPEYYAWLTGQCFMYNNRQVRLGMCDADLAFARVVYPFSAPGGTILTVTYKLDIIVDTGIHFTSLIASSQVGGTNNWQSPSNTYSSITQPGVMLINDGTIYNSSAPNGSRLQHFDYNVGDGRTYIFQNEYGESFVPPLGAPLEPSNLFLQGGPPGNRNMVIYLSDDNTQFLVNSNGGAFTNTGNYAPWNIWTDNNINIIYSYGQIVSSGGNSYQYQGINPSSGNYLFNGFPWVNIGTMNVIYPFTSGVMPFRNDNDASIVDNNYWSAGMNYNIRTNSGHFPSGDDITQQTAGHGTTFLSVEAQTPTFQSNSSRSAQVNYSYEFPNYQSPPNQLYVKSFVAAYVDAAVGQGFGMGDGVNLVPFFDAVFSGQSENADNAFLPQLISGDIIDEDTVGVWVTQYPEPDYNYLDGTFSAAPYPIFNMVLGWSVPCGGAVGC